MHRLARLLSPKSIAVIGGGVWCENILTELRKIGYAGAVWPVHPTKRVLGGLPTVSRIEDLPEAPDAAFIGVNRHLTIEAVRALAARGAGGAVCFASGFREAAAELDDGADLQAALVAAAGKMPILGPNCYGMINALDGAALWPDQHGAVRVERGVALITQSSNIAINLTMQRRGLPVAYVVTAGNQAMVDQTEIGRALLQDPRVTALGLHIEGISDLSGMQALAAEARQLGKPVVVLKVGASDHAQAATVSHTASLAGSDAGARALFRRLGIAQVDSLPVLLDTLQILHLAGPLANSRIASASCSGGEASLMADTALRHGVEFPPLNGTQRSGLAAALGPKVALANPLDYHTYIWGDVPAMTATFAALLQGDIGLGCVVVDFPRTDRCDRAAWDCVIEAAGAARAQVGKPLALVTSLPENLSEEVAQEVIAAGLIPLFGLEEAQAAIAAASRVFGPEAAPVWPPQMPDTAEVLTEAESKAELRAFGLSIPASARADSETALREAVASVGLPCVIKAEGLAHKSDMGGVVFADTDADRAIAAALAMPCDTWLVEEAIHGAVAELLVGVVCDPAHGYVLTLGAGGVQTEILQDTQSLLLPVNQADILAALDRLRIAPILRGYRGKPGVDKPALARAVLAVQSYVEQSLGSVAEVEINPILATPDRAVAVDALIRKGPTR